MKKSFSMGLAILLPIALTIWVIKYLFDLFTNPLFHYLEIALLWFEKRSIFAFGNHEVIITFLGRVAALVLTFLFITLLGFVARRFFFKGFLNFLNRLILKIPIVGGVYRVLRDVIRGIFLSDQKFFKETVLVPFPAPETYSLGFITGEPPHGFKKFIPLADTTVFIPTAPHPISGYLLLCPRSSLHLTKTSVEDAFKFLFSCGVIHPSNSP